MVFIIFLFFLFFSRPVFASPDIEITDFSSNSNPEWIQITNNTNDTINLENWSFEDESKTPKTINICLSPKSTQILEYLYSGNFGWLNNTKSTGNTYADIIYLYNSSPIKTLIHEYPYTNGVDKPKPESTNTCVINPSPTIAATTTPTSPSTSTPDPTETNPSDAKDYISLTEFMPYSDPEWVEIYNNKNNSVKLVNWKIEDLAGNSKNIDSLLITAKGYAVFELKSLIFDNNNDEKVILKDQDNKIIAQVVYNKGLLTSDKSWSNVFGSWCQANITQNKTNETSCYTPPTPTQKTATPTVTPTNTTTPTAVPTDKNLYKADALATESAIIAPIEESSFYTTPNITTAPLSSKLVLGETTTVKKNYLPLIFIISGGLLLATPIILDKIKKK